MGRYPYLRMLGIYLSVKCFFHSWMKVHTTATYLAFYEPKCSVRITICVKCSGQILLTIQCFYYPPILSSYLLTQHHKKNLCFSFLGMTLSSPFMFFGPTILYAKNLQLMIYSTVSTSF